MSLVLLPEGQNDVLIFSSSSSPTKYLACLSVLVQYAQMGLRNCGWFFLYVLLLCFSLNTRLSVGAGTLSVGESIFGYQTIVSGKDGIFELGFFKPGNLQNYYIGIWYRKISEFTVVWVANRDKPLNDK